MSVRTITINIAPEWGADYMVSLGGKILHTEAAIREKIAKEIEALGDSFPIGSIWRSLIAEMVRHPEIVAKQAPPLGPCLRCTRGAMFLHHPECTNRYAAARDPKPPMLQSPRDIGKYYRTRDGRVVGPLTETRRYLRQNSSAMMFEAWPFEIIGVGSYRADGKYLGNVDNCADLIAEASNPAWGVFDTGIWDKTRTVPPKPPAPKSWRDVPVTAGMLFDVCPVSNVARAVETAARAKVAAP